MTFNLKVVSASLIVIFIAVFGLFYITDNILKIRERCETDKSLKICTMSSLPTIMLMMLLIVGGLIMVVNVTAYILITGATSV